MRIPIKHCGSIVEGEVNFKVLGNLSEPERMHAFPTGNTRIRKREADAIARILTASRKLPKTSGCRGLGALEYSLLLTTRLVACLTLQFGLKTHLECFLDIYIYIYIYTYGTFSFVRMLWRVKLVRLPC